MTTRSSLTLALTIPLLLLPALAFEPTPTLPFNWTTLSACAVDNPARILSNDVTTQTDDNTPAACVASCAQAGFGYAGVEFGDECHCGTGLVAPIEPAPTDGCNIPCTGDADFACGGSWAIQVYTFPALRPGTWIYEGCVTDTLDAPAFPQGLTQTFESNLDLVNQCLQACGPAGFAFAGVRNAAECVCSADSVAQDAAVVDESQCSSLCPLPGNAGFEFCGGVDRLGVYKFTG